MVWGGEVKIFEKLQDLGYFYSNLKDKNVIENVDSNDCIYEVLYENKDFIGNRFDR